MTRFLLAIALTLFLASCGNEATSTVEDTSIDGAGELNLYSSRHYDTDIALYENFERETGIKINRIEAGADALIERIISEGEFSPADLLVTVDAGRLWRAEEAGILAAIDSPLLEERIPANLRQDDGLWFGLSKRARVIIYNKNNGLPEGLTRYQDLADPAFQGQVCMRSSSNIYNISLLASLIAHDGTEAAEAWARGVVANFQRPAQGNDTAQIEAVASGECTLSTVNTYYLARFVGSDDPQRQAIADQIGVIFPNQDDTGTHVNISGAGLLKNAPNRDNAIAYLEYLTTPEAQSYFANGNNEYPVVAGVAPASNVASLGTYREDSLDARMLGVNQAEAVRIFDRVGWP
jgi:iron(III) transport system substrate-binding protein